MRGREQQKHRDVPQGLGMATIPMLPPWHHPSHQRQAAKGMPPAGYCSSPWPKPTSSPCYPSPAASATQKGTMMLVARRRVVSTPRGTHSTDAGRASPSPYGWHTSTNAPGITAAVKILSSRRCASSDGHSWDAGPGAAWRQSTVSTRGAITQAFPALQPTSARRLAQLGYQQVPPMPRDVGPHFHTPAEGVPGQFSWGSAASRWAAASFPHEPEGR